MHSLFRKSPGKWHTFAADSANERQEFAQCYSKLKKEMGKHSWKLLQLKRYYKERWEGFPRVLKVICNDSPYLHNLRRRLLAQDFGPKGEMESATPEGEAAPGTAGFGLALLVADADTSDSSDDEDFDPVAAMELQRGDPGPDVELSADEMEASDTSDDDSSDDDEPPVSYWNPEEGEAGDGVDYEEIMEGRPNFHDTEPEECGDLEARESKRSVLLNPLSGLTDTNTGRNIYVYSLCAFNSPYGRFSKFLQTSNVPIAHRVELALSELNDKWQNIMGGEIPAMFAKYLDGPIKHLKPKLAAALRAEFMCVIKAEHYQIFKAWRSFRPCTRAWSLVDIAHLRRRWLAAVEQAKSEGKPPPTVLGFLAPSTLLAVDAICGLATIDRYEVKEQLSEIVIWANANWEPSDTTECQKNIIRWYKGEKVQGYLKSNRTAALMKYVRFVLCQRPSTAHVESKFSHVTGRANRHAVGIGMSRLHDMLVLKGAPVIDEDYAESPLRAEVDATAFLQVDLTLF
jgi:hypothetical protein